MDSQRGTVENQSTNSYEEDNGVTIEFIASTICHTIGKKKTMVLPYR